MNLGNLKQIVTSKAGRQMLKLQKNSPHILFGVGVVGVVATAVTASVQTLKVEGILDGHAEQMAKIDFAVRTPEINYSEADAQRDTYLQYAKTTIKIVQLYALPIGLGITSVGCLAGSHRILTARNAALGAAVASLETAFEKYRQRVIAEFGPEKDREFRFATEKVEVIEETETGPQPKEIVRVDKDAPTYLYARFFDESNKNWEPRSEYNVMFLRTAQQRLNDKLRARGHVFLNEVYDTLGMDRSKEGAVVGWLYDGDGDGYIDFGIWDRERDEHLFEFVTGRENAILLDFNVDGSIWDKI